jgi:predicted lipoprotein
MASAAGELRAWALLGAVAVAAIAAPPACAPPDEADPIDAAIAATLADAGARVVLPALGALRDRADALDAALADAASQPDAPSLHEEAGRAWRAAMAAWQTVEVFQVGPLADPLLAPGGEGLAAKLYAWPETNPCRVDQELVAAAWGSATYFADTLPNVHGLAAIEQLLFPADDDNHCPPQVNINAEGTWAALSPAELDQRRLDYAAALARHLAEQTTDLHDAWDPAAGDFAGALAEAGDNAPYTSPQQGVQALFDAAFFTMFRVVRLKLDEPMGLGTCTTDCATKAESVLAGGSIDHLRHNLAAIRALLEGGDGTGLLDLARAAGHDDVVDLVEAALADADAAAANVDADVPEALLSDAADLEAFRAALEHLKERIEDDLRVALTLQIPSEAAGDND